MDLFISQQYPNQSSAQCHKCRCDHDLDFTKLIFVQERTRLWRWMVYSRATTSAMALRCLPADLVLVDMFCRWKQVLVSNRSRNGDGADFLRLRTQ